MGIGLLSYYQGRSHDHNLVLVLWPAVLILFIVSQLALDGYKGRRLRFPYAFSFLWSVMSVGALATVQLSCGIPTLVKFTGRHINDIRHPTSVISEDVSFIATSLQESKDCALLADDHVVYQAELNLAAPWQGTALPLLILKSDVESINQQLLNHPPEHIVIGTPSTYLGTDGAAEGVRLSEIIGSRYHLVGQTRDGRLSFYRRN
jgi:hypothetical protein